MQDNSKIPVNTTTWHLAEGQKFKLPLVRKEEEEDAGPECGDQGHVEDPPGVTHHGLQAGLRPVWGGLQRFVHYTGYPHKLFMACLRLFLAKEPASKLPKVDKLALIKC